MQIELFDIFLLTFIGVFLWHWWASQQVKEIAFKNAQRTCKEMGLQLLDGSISLRGIWIKRDENGQLRWWRRYMFDFSATGDDRYRGTIITLGHRVIHTQLPPHRIADNATD